MMEVKRGWKCKQSGGKRERTEDDVLAIEPGGHDGGDKELRAVRVRAGIGHGEEEWAVMLELEVLICSSAVRQLHIVTIPQYEGQ